MVAKPMDPEEAAMQLNLSAQDFMVFRNSRSSDINVIYKKKDGNVGLIEPSNWAARISSEIAEWNCRKYWMKTISFPI